MNVLIVGGGGREHALAWKAARSPRVAKVFVAPGNAGTAAEPNVVNVPITAIPALIEFAKSQPIALTIVGPEAPLAAGIVDAFEAAGLRIFGPRREAARLESSKDFAKAFMVRHAIPTAAYRTFAEAADAHAYVRERGAPIVVKADGLAAGKGVVVALTEDEAHAAAWWFGGGMDLTPIYGFADDARHFHRVCRDALAPFGSDLYPRMKHDCDRYFYLRHRQEARGIGGIFYDLSLIHI